MKTLIRWIAATVVVAGLTTITEAQTSSTSSPSTATSGNAVVGGTATGRTDIYHVHVVHAAPGKAAELGETLKTPGPSPAPLHQAVFRHQYGDSWDYVVVAHYGTKFTVEAARQSVPAAQRSLSDCHTDTICTGPSWAEFSRAMGLDDAKKSTGGVYVVSMYRATAGGRDALERNLAEPPDPAMDKAAGAALLQHQEGADWNFLGLVRYNSWGDLATSQTNSVPKTAEKDSGWSKMREVTATHTDTLCDRTAP